MSLKNYRNVSVSILILEQGSNWLFLVSSQPTVGPQEFLSFGVWPHVFLIVIKSEYVTANIRVVFQSCWVFFFSSFLKQLWVEVLRFFKHLIPCSGRGAGTVFFFTFLLVSWLALARQTQTDSCALLLERAKRKIPQTQFLFFHCCYFNFWFPVLWALQLLLITLVMQRWAEQTRNSSFVRAQRRSTSPLSIKSPICSLSEPLFEPTQTDFLATKSNLSLYTCFVLWIFCLFVCF